MKVHVIVAGSRGFEDYTRLVEEMNKLLESLKEDKEDITIVNGKARGADRLSSRYAVDYGYGLKEFPAKWNEYGRGAGYIRNKEMVSYVSSKEGKKFLIAFWDGNSAGTRNTIELAHKAKFNVVIVPVLTTG